MPRFLPPAAARPRRTARLALAWLAGVLCLGAQAQYPEQPIRWVIPFAAGGGSDVAARLVAQEMAKDLGQQIIIDNRPGGNTLIATQVLMGAKPDGYTIMSASLDTLTINPHLYKVPYRIDTDFAYVANFVKFPTILVAKKSFPADTAQQTLQWMRSHGPSLNYASYGSGSVAHIGMEMLQGRLGTRLNHVPYKGAAPAVQDLAGGQVDIMFCDIPTALPHVQSGRIKALAWPGKERNAALPELPTLQEAGVAGFDFYSWQGVIAPKGTPAAAVQRLSAALQKAMASEAIRRELPPRGIDPHYLGPAEFRALALGDSEKMKKVIADNQIVGGN